VGGSLVDNTAQQVSKTTTNRQRQDLPSSGHHRRHQKQQQQHQQHHPLALPLATALSMLITAPNASEDADNSSSAAYFVTPLLNHVTTRAGQAATLTCIVKQLGSRQVSWIRGRDLHVLSSGQVTFSSDSRISVSHVKDSWTLTIRYTQPRDAGSYSCQVNTQPLIASWYNLTVVGQSLYNLTVVGQSLYNLTVVGQSLYNLTGVGQSLYNLTGVGQSLYNLTGVGQSLYNLTGVGQSLYNLTGVGQSLYNLTVVGQGLYNLTVVGQSLYNLTGVGQSLYNLTGVGQSLYNLTGVGQSLYNLTGVGQSLYNLTGVGQSLYNLTGVGQSLYNLTGVGQSLYNLTGVGQSLYNLTGVGQSLYNLTGVGQSLYNLTGVGQSLYNLTGVGQSLYNLTGVEARANILGKETMYVQSGSTVTLECVIKEELVIPGLVLWYQDDRLVDRDSRRVKVVTQVANVTTSTLTVTTAAQQDSGNYSCWPSSGRPDSVLVHVIQGEPPAAMQHGNSAAWVSTLLLVPATLTSLLFLLT
ncbi:Zwei Ig domain protein zig-8-like 2, partial [Homarus americanus]